MVAEPLVHKVISMANSSSEKAMKAGAASGDGVGCSRVGILSFKAANAMSRAAALHRSLSDAEAARLLGPLCLGSRAVRALVPGDDARLLALALVEKLDALNRVAAVAARLGRRCTAPALQGFDHVYADLLAGRSGALAPAFAPDSAAASSLVCQLDRLAASTAALYAELDALADLEQSARKLPTDEARRALEQRARWRHRHDSRQLFSGPVTAPLSEKSGPFIKVDVVDTPRPTSLRPSNCGRNMFMECLSLSSSASWKDGFDEDFSEDASCISTIRSGMLVPFSGEYTLPTTTTKNNAVKIKRLRFGPKSTVTSLASPSTIGGSALALHYANIIIIIEKLLQYPHLVGEEARDDLYASVKHEARETLEKTLAWLAPMAHDTMRWQDERSFEQQQIVLKKGNVLLLQTLYFADREKTEAAICELLVGLNYICRYEQQQNALLDCSSSLDFDDCFEWQLQ
ncbi:unnamed protein product [Alopecurus aequalis]